ncbi:hypothetical protein Sango_1062500 [Sesamum angolense]|uniref:Uncharacterized protein n=1 Tax=Sesamum angolense TaxID=2727404 RepID=A0AAE2BZ81_9LAMI|nr:hypothetical protein Sango_1062500 [Sesamum angolense]
MDKPLPQTLPNGSSSEERETFERWHADRCKFRSIILASMSDDVQKQYDRLDDVASNLQRMKEVYAILDRHTRYVATKEFFRAKMTEGSSVQEHGVKMLSLVEKLEDLKVGLEKDTYIDMILQSLPPSYDPFIVNFNMNGLEKFINELINMLVQYEATIKKSGPSVLIGEASNSKAKGKRAGRWKRKKDKAKAKTIVAAKNDKSAPIAPVGMGKEKKRMGTQQQSRANDICVYCHEKEHWKRDCSNLSSDQGMFVVEVIMVTNSASWVLNTDCGAHVCNDLHVLQRSRKLGKDEVVLRLGDGKAVAAEAIGIINLVPALAISKIQSSYARDCHDSSSQRSNSRTIRTGNPSHTDQALRGFHTTIPASHFSQLTTLPTNPLKLHRRPTSPTDETRLQYLVQVSIGSSMPNLEVLDLEHSRPTLRSWVHSCQTYAQPNSTG